MRVKFRIVLLKDGKRLKKKDLISEKDPLLVGMRYITEFKYLEATKWLLIAEDCKEKYLLLGLIHRALDQEDSALEFLEQVSFYDKKTNVDILLEVPEKGTAETVSI